MIDLSIIIVSWNVRKHLERCLASIEKTRGDLSIEIFVVDNASTDGTVDFVRNFQFPCLAGRQAISNLQFILNKKNLGFAAANNQAITQAKGEYLLLLNPDTELQPHTLQQMMVFMRAHPRCGILGPKLLNGDRTLQPSVRRFPDAWSAIALSLRLSAKRYMALDFDYTKEQEADQVMGACFLIRHACMEQIGMLDERFFIWFEEVDYCKRAKDAGWGVWYTSSVAVLHHGGQSFAQVLTAKKQWMFSKSLCYYFWKHGQWGAYFITIVTTPFRLFFSLLR